MGKVSSEFKYDHPNKFDLMLIMILDWSKSKISKDEKQKCGVSYWGGGKCTIA